MTPLRSLSALSTLILSIGLAAPGYANGLSEAYFTDKNPQLTPQERAAIDLAKKWQAVNPSGIKPVAGPDGSIRFLFGSQQPSIVYAVLQVCDIELQPGEQVNSIHLGDQARWLIEPAVTGQGSTEVQHLIVKPMDVGLETSLVVTTNRRTYHMRLRSHRRDFMPRVSFIYPEDTLAKWDAIRNKESHARDIKKSRTFPETGEYLGNLDFAYAVSGNAAWKPLRVYNDGQKTIIQMPAIMAQTEAPTLLLLSKEGGIFSGDETVTVNYRLQGDRYIVDTVFDKAILIAGVGGNQSRVMITRGN
ncbi:P-type conjugative transfer protein TrbG [Nitrosomonas sp. Nm132]|uniref:P-type conjugative transfer protein TrbG n=1 Tax=Nitrosomonas sp. Nm132 TaxID=1881053 RepID=UPI000882B3E7|nr:P-type conjugative transfer protein TrbG [Nitrosomonas sp. Nm132]SDH44565.1 type IV secretion system protein VirB9 [Nitrosomonas sp. Nm132]